VDVAASVTVVATNVVTFLKILFIFPPWIGLMV
jgi:hypothetical protein